MPNRKDVPQRGGDPDPRDPRPRQLERPVRQRDRNEALEHVEEHDLAAGPLAERSTDVRRTDVAAADGPQIDAFARSKQDAE